MTCNSIPFFKLDLVNKCHTSNYIENNNELNILLMGQADFRHVLKTLATYSDPESLPRMKEIHVGVILN